MAHSTTLEARPNGAVAAQQADSGRRTVYRTLAHVEYAVSVERDVHGPLDVIPDSQELSFRGKDLDAVVLTVTEVDLAVLPYYQAVGQVELVGALLTRLTPRRFQVAVRREAVDPSVAVAVRDV